MATRLTIDDTLDVFDQFGFEPDEIEEGVSETRTLTGDRHTYSRFFKEGFTLSFTDLDINALGTLLRLVRQTGLNNFHKVEINITGLRRVWDGVTAWSAGVNSDIQATRKKVKFSNFTYANHEGHPDRYQASLHCQET